MLTHDLAQSTPAKVVVQDQDGLEISIFSMDGDLEDKKNFLELSVGRKRYRVLFDADACNKSPTLDTSLALAALEENGDVAKKEENNIFKRRLRHPSYAAAAASSAVTTVAGVSNGHRRTVSMSSAISAYRAEYLAHRNAIKAGRMLQTSSDGVFCTVGVDCPDDDDPLVSSAYELVLDCVHEDYTGSNAGTTARTCVTFHTPSESTEVCEDPSLSSSCLAP